ncbi:MAG TPA: amino acid adenylation domain-containing protein, partial [Longimicrobiaceae bacterium]
AGRLELQIGYAEGVHRHETVERLAEGYADELRELIAHCTSEEAGGYTPSDFPLAGLKQAELDGLLGSERGVEDVYPLTPLQEGMLFHTLYAPGSSLYVGQFGFLLEGPLEAQALERAWQGTVDRQEALRAGFVWEGVPRPVQVIRREARLPLRREDWRELGEAERAERLERYLEEDRGRGFDLERGPLMRLGLFRVEEDAYQLVWTHHHLVLDGWSLSLLFGDVLRLYAAYARGEAPRAGAGRRYREYVAWLERQDRSAAERYWREALAGFGAATVLPGVHRVRGGEQGQGSAKVTLSAERTRGLQEQARRWGVTLNTVVQGAWGLLLSRYAGEEDVVFGTTVSGRPVELVGAEETVGMFINTLPVRVRVRGELEVGEWLAQLQREQAEAREYEYAPLVQVQKWSEMPAGEALFESLVVYENYPVDRALEEQTGGLGGLRVRSSFGREEANDPLVLSAQATPTLQVELAYDRGRIEGEVAERLPGQLEVVLEAMAADSARRISQLSLLRDAERLQVLEGGRGEARAFPRDAVVHEVIAVRAAAWPDSVAVASGGRSLTYRELNEEAARLAARLRGHGLRPEAVVAVFLDRSVELAVALLATLQAGGAFVPLDPGYPRERLEYLLADSAAAVLLTRAGLASALPQTGAAVVHVDAPAAPAEGELPRGISPDQLAYLIYTSGSTGRPKAVMVSHRSLLCYGEAMRERMELGAGDRVLQFASPAFDVMIEEVFPAWLSGACVVFPQGDLLGSPQELLQLLERERVSVMELPTAYWHEWVRALWEEGAHLPPSVRLVLMGGERVLRERMEQWAVLGAPLLHVFGLTETTVTSTTLRLEAGDDGSRWSNLPVGVPLPNAAVYVLDVEREPVPAGVPGELYLGGETVARGYFGRPGLTAERYVPDPFATESGARLYRTGDRVRWLADGTLEFLGRIDQQVKVRGYRIEPAEIEAVLAEHPAVREAAVVVREDVPGDRRLVAYLVPAGEEVPVPGVRDFLRGRLPEYMVPGAFVALEAIPLTPNGKVDRRALPAPERTAAEEASYAAPRTGTEAALAGIWAEVLRLERVGI